MRWRKKLCLCHKAPAHTHLLPVKPLAHWHCPVSGSHLPLLWQTHSSAQFGPYRPSWHRSVQTAPCRSTRRKQWGCTNWNETRAQYDRHGVTIISPLMQVSSPKTKKPHNEFFTLVEKPKSSPEMTGCLQSVSSDKSVLKIRDCSSKSLRASWTTTQELIQSLATFTDDMKVRCQR